VESSTGGPGRGNRTKRDERATKRVKTTGGGQAGSSADDVIVIDE
jgi:hypothetical protein